MFSIIKVQGDSMFPLYKEGDYLFVLELFKASWLRPNRNILFYHEHHGLLVKKITTVNKEQKEFHSKGLNGKSISQKEIGAVPFNRVKGIPLIHIRSN
jgi:signal peptidase I